MQDEGEQDAQAGGAPSEGELLAGQALEGPLLATRTGQLDVMLEYLWQVRIAHTFYMAASSVFLALERAICTAGDEQ